ncbi:MAG: EamA family transporter [Thermoguttaceae bacterium]
MPLWIVYSLGAMAFLAAMTLMFVPVTRSTPPSVVLFYLFVAVAIVNFGYLRYQGTPLNVSTTGLLWILAAALASFCGNLCNLNAIKLAPNAGYAAAIEASKAPVVVLMAALLFAQHLSFTKGLGAALCAIGVALLSL